MFCARFWMDAEFAKYRYFVHAMEAFEPDEPGFVC